MVPQPVMPMGTPIILENNSDLKRIGIVCTKDKLLIPEFQGRIYLKADCEIKHLDSGHAPFFYKPEELCEILMMN